MRVEAFGRVPAGEVEFGFYAATGETSIMIVDGHGAPLLKATVTLHPPSPRAGDDEVWLKVVEANDGVDAALVKAGVVELTDDYEDAGFVPAYARRAKLTAEALAEIERALPKEARDARDLIRKREAGR